MKKLSFILILLPVLFFSCSNPTIENVLETKTEHSFQVQKLFYDETLTLGKSNTMYVAVYADGYTCTKCGTKYHTNEFYSRYPGEQLSVSEFRSKVTAKYRTMGYGYAAAMSLANDVLNIIYNGLWPYYFF